MAEQCCKTCKHYEPYFENDPPGLGTCEVQFDRDQLPQWLVIESYEREVPETAGRECNLFRSKESGPCPNG